MDTPFTSQTQLRYDMLIFTLLALVVLAMAQSMTTEVETEIKTEMTTAVVTQGGSDTAVSTTLSSNTDSSDAVDTANTTPSTQTQVECYNCEGKDCAKLQTDTDTKCVSSDNTCWMKFTMSSDVAVRSCVAPPDMSTCSSPHPGGVYANGVCAFCCSGSKCNTAVLSDASCTNLEAYNSATAIPFNPVLLALLSASSYILNIIL